MEIIESGKILGDRFFYHYSYTGCIPLLIITLIKIFEEIKFFKD
jgi:hypothetical protein